MVLIKYCKSKKLKMSVAVSAAILAGSVNASVGPETWTSRYYSSVSGYNALFYGADFLDADTVLVSGTGHLADNPGMGIRYSAVTGIPMDTPAEWISYANTGRDTAFKSQFVGNNGDIFYAGQEIGGGSDIWHLWKYLTDGTLATGWPVNMNGTDRVYDVAEDSLGNVYGVGESYNTNASINDWVIYKYQSNGDLVAGFPLTYGGSAGYQDLAYCIAIDSDDNFIVAGLDGSSATTNQWLVRKYDKSNNSVIWEKTMGPAGVHQYPRDIIVDAQDNVIVVGNIDNGTDNDSRFVKFAKVDGNILWDKTWSSGTEDLADAAVLDERGNFYTAMRVFNKDSHWRYHVQYRNGQTGDLLKSQEINHLTTFNDSPGTETNSGAPKIALQGNQLVLAGYTDDTSNPAVYDLTAFATMLKLLPDIGTLKWQKIFNSVNNLGNNGFLFGAFEAVDFLDSNTVLASGHPPSLSVRYDVTTGDVKDTPPEWIQDNIVDNYFFTQVVDGNADIYMAGRTGNPIHPTVWKYNSVGASQWKKIDSAHDNAWNMGIAQDSAGYLYLAGIANEDWYINKLSKTDGSAAPGFPILYDDGGLYDKANAVAVDSQGNFVVVGFITVDDVVDHNDWYVRKYASDGSLLWDAQYDDPNGLNDQAHSVVIDSQDNIIVSGYQNAGTGKTVGRDDDWYMVKYAKDGDGAGGATVLWAASWDDGHKRNGTASTLLLDAADNVYVGGSQNNSTGEARGYLQYRSGATGELLKFKRLPHPVTHNSLAGTAGAEHDALKSLALDGQHLVIAGIVWEGYKSYGRTGFIQMLDIEHTVNVQVTGEGQVSSTGTPSGIDMVNCTDNCMGSYPGAAAVTLTPTLTNPDWTQGSWLWSGDCVGDTNDCVVNVDTDKNVGVSFSCVSMDISQPAVPIDSSLPDKVCDDIKAVNGYEITVGGDVSFRATNSIALGAGFKVNGGVFHAIVQ